MYRMKNDQLNLKRPDQINNEKDIRDLVQFSNYDFKRQQNIKSLIDHMKWCAKCTEDIFPPPPLKEPKFLEFKMSQNFALA